MFKRDFDNIFSFLLSAEEKGTTTKLMARSESEDEKSRKPLEREEVTDSLLMIVPRQ